MQTKPPHLAAGEVIEALPPEMPPACCALTGATEAMTTASAAKLERSRKRMMWFLPSVTRSGIDKLALPGHIGGGCEPDNKLAIDRITR
jgi:hypothetical protein